MNAQQKRTRKLTHAPFMRARLYNYEAIIRRRQRAAAIADTAALILWLITTTVLTLVAIGRLH